MQSLHDVGVRAGPSISVHDGKGNNTYAVTLSGESNSQDGPYGLQLDQSKLSLSQNELNTKARKSHLSMLTAVPDLDVRDPAALEAGKLGTVGNEPDNDLTPEEKIELKLARLVDVPKSEH